MKINRYFNNTTKVMRFEYELFSPIIPSPDNQTTLFATLKSIVGVNPLDTIWKWISPYYKPETMSARIFRMNKREYQMCRHRSHHVIYITFTHWRPIGVKLKQAIIHWISDYISEFNDALKNSLFFFFFYKNTDHIIHNISDIYIWQIGKIKLSNP